MNLRQLPVRVVLLLLASSNASVWSQQNRPYYSPNVRTNPSWNGNGPDLNTPWNGANGFVDRVYAEGDATRSDSDQPSSDDTIEGGKSNEAAKKDIADKNGNSNGDGKENANGEKSKPRFDPSLVASGEAAFNRSCTSCHDAQKSLSKSKSLSGWRSTVLRMAAKADANVPASETEAIATYLVSRTSGGGDGSTGNGKSDQADSKSTDDSGEKGGVSFFGTISPTWRGGNDNLQNPGFFPDVWVGASWQTGTPISGKVTACISCHTIEEGQGDRLELVEASLKYDLSSFFAGCCSRNLKSSVEAGRFVVPFGAFAAQSNPGVYRTVTRPLIFNMGQRIHDGDIGDPVLPMPYADEGANFHFGVDVTDATHGAFDAYVVNGLQGSRAGINFDRSRDYVDSDNQPAVGGRFTFGGKALKIGSSYMTGQFSPNGAIPDIPNSMFYHIWGYDAVFRLDDLVRIQFEYARRDSDRGSPNDPPLRTRDKIDGYYIEGEFLISRAYKTTFLVRYDWMHRASAFPPPESALPDTTFGVARITYGPTFSLANGSLLMINHEHWWLPGGLERTDVLGLRWSCTF